MACIQKQRGKYRARFSEPFGNVQSRTFARKADAERFLRQIDADRLRGQWSIRATPKHRSPPARLSTTGRDAVCTALSQRRRARCAVTRSCCR